MLTKTKIASVTIAMIAFGSIFGISQIQEDNVPTNSQKIPTPTNVPLPPPIKLGNYGLVEELGKLNPLNYNVKTLDTDRLSDLKLVETRISHGGYITSFYAPEDVKFTSETTLPEFIKDGGVVAIFSEIGENYDVNARISKHVEKTGNEDLSFQINGDRAIGVMKNTEFDLPTKIHLYQEDGTFVTFLGWQSVSELQKIAETLQ